MLTNLIGNALEYTSGQVKVEGPHDRLAAGSRSRSPTQGPGLPPGSLQDLFEKTGPAGRNRSQGGLGLGLYLCRLVVERSFGGRIWVASSDREGHHFQVHRSAGISRSVTPPLHGDERHRADVGAGRRRAWSRCPTASGMGRPTSTFPPPGGPWEPLALGGRLVGWAERGGLAAGAAQRRAGCQAGRRAARPTCSARLGHKLRSAVLALQESARQAAFGRPELLETVFEQAQEVGRRAAALEAAAVAAEGAAARGRARRRAQPRHARRQPAHAGRGGGARLRAGAGRGLHARCATGLAVATSTCPLSRSAPGGR